MVGIVSYGFSNYGFQDWDYSYIEGSDFFLIRLFLLSKSDAFHNLIDALGGGMACSARSWNNVRIYGEELILLLIL